MILYKVIKYKILDYCLEMFFDKIGRNFSSGNRISAREVSAGMTFSRMIFRGSLKNGRLRRVWDNCEILKVMSFKEGAGAEFYITFRFAHCNYKLIDMFPEETDNRTELQKYNATHHTQIYLESPDDMEFII